MGYVLGVCVGVDKESQEVGMYVKSGLNVD